MPQRFLLFAAADSSCYLKVDGENGTRHFTDFLEALNFAHSVAGAGRAEVVVYDPTGKVALERLRIGEDYSEIA